MRPEINICVATYKRPELLQKLLLSLRGQQSDGEFTFTIIVADNDAQGSAEAVVREFNTNGQKIIYEVEPEQNISLARNKSLSRATGDYIATIDDDEYADPHWLHHLYRAITSYQADVVHGPVIPEFHSKAPAYIRACAIFNRPNPPTGANENYVCATGNSLFRRELLAGVATPFDPRFGRTGGEDTIFFNQLKKRCCRMIWCRDALVFSLIPPRKANWRWILRREFRAGNGYYRIFDQGPVDPQLPRATNILVLSKRAAKLCYPVPLYIYRGLFDMQYAVKAIERLRPTAFYAGIIAHLLGFQYEEYRGR